MNASWDRPRRSGVTLAELLVALSIVGIVGALTMSSVERSREAAARVACQNNLRQLALAVHGYHVDRRQLPPYMASKPGAVHGGWFTHLLPYVGEAPLYEQIRMHDEPMINIISPAFRAPGMRNRAFPVLRCESDPSARPAFGTTNYLANWYAFTAGSHGAYSAPRAWRDMEDGPSNVILFAEGYSSCERIIRHAFEPPRYHNFGITGAGKPSDDPSYLPREYATFQVKPDGCDPWRTQTPHADMQAVTADGAVRIIRGSIEPRVWLQLLKPADGAPAGNDW